MKSIFASIMLGLLALALLIGCTGKVSKPNTTPTPSETASPTASPSAAPSPIATAEPSSTSASLEPFTKPAINMDAITPETYIVTSKDVNIRSGPGVSYQKLGILSNGEKETGIVKNGWLEFTYNGEKAYCSMDYLKLETSASANAD